MPKWEKKSVEKVRKGIGNRRNGNSYARGVKKAANREAPQIEKRSPKIGNRKFYKKIQ